MRLRLEREIVQPFAPSGAWTRWFWRGLIAVQCNNQTIKTRPSSKLHHRWRPWLTPYPYPCPTPLPSPWCSRRHWGAEWQWGTTLSWITCIGEEKQRRFATKGNQKSEHIPSSSLRYLLQSCGKTAKGQFCYVVMLQTSCTSLAHTDFYVGLIWRLLSLETNIKGTILPIMLLAHRRVSPLKHQLDISETPFPSLLRLLK